MDSNKQQIIKCAESFYNAKITNEYSSGCSYNLTFEIEKDSTPLILRVSECDEEKERHVDLELNWMDYLAAKLDNIVKPVKNARNKLYDIVNIDDKSYIFCVFEKAKGKHVDVNSPAEFNGKLFYDLGYSWGTYTN